MKRSGIIFFLFAIFTIVSVSAENGIKFHMSNGETRSVALSRIDSLSFDATEEYMFVSLTSGRDTLLINDIDSIAYGELSTAVAVTYAGATAYVDNPFAFDGVSVDISGAKITVCSTADTDIDYILSGESDEGCFKIYGTKKYTLHLAGVTLANDSGAAINSQCKKRGKIILEEGSVNILSDAEKYTSALGEDEKATIFGEGQFIFDGSGELYVTGNYKHAVCSDDYLAFRGGKITVLSAASDALHSNDSIIVEGGTLALAADADGIDCDGYVSVSGGDVTIELSSDDKKGVKAGGDITISGGTLTVNASGNIVKGIKSSRNVNVTGGDINITLGGNSLVESGEPSYCTAIKCDSIFALSDGTLAVEATGTASRGISADGDVIISGGECNIVCSGGYGVYDPSASDDVESEPVATYVVYVCPPTSTSSGMGNNNNGPGGFSSSSTWSNIYLYNSSNTLVATLTNSVTVNGSVFYYYDFGAETTESYYFKSDNSFGKTIKSSTFTGVTGDAFYTISSSYTSSGNTRTYTLTDVTDEYADAVVSSGSSTEKSYAAVGINSDADISVSGGTHTLIMSGNASKGLKSDGNIDISGGETDITTTGSAAIVAYDPVYCTAVKCDEDFTMSNGLLVIKASGNGGMGVSADGVLTVSCGEADITISGAGSSYTAQSGTDYYSTKALKSDGAMNLIGGTLNCTATATGGKCVVADGLLTIGVADDESGYPYITAKTTGSAISSGSSSSGGMGMGGMQEEGFNGAPKAIKGKSDVVVNSGTITLSTAADGGEGLESKSTLTINGGVFEINTYDDAINASNSIVINGGYIYAVATNNDAIDSNGTIAINGGVVLASGTSQPEGGIDCDSNSFVITGGIVVATGGSSSSPTSTSQYYASLSSVTVSAGKYLVFNDASGNVLFAYKCPNSVSGASVLVSSPDFTSSTHTMLYGVSSLSSSQSSLFGDVYLVGGTASGGTSKSFTPSKK